MGGLLNKNGTQMKRAESGLAGCWLPRLQQHASKPRGQRSQQDLFYCETTQQEQWAHCLCLLVKEAMLGSASVLRQDTILLLCSELPTKLVASSLNHKSTQRSQQDLFCCEATEEEQWAHCLCLLATEAMLGSASMLILLSCSELGKDTTKLPAKLMASSLSHKPARPVLL